MRLGPARSGVPLARFATAPNTSRFASLCSQVARRCRDDGARQDGRGLRRGSSRAAGRDAKGAFLCVRLRPFIVGDGAVPLC
jgi:hypothetical protein